MTQFVEKCVNHVKKIKSYITHHKTGKLNFV